MTLGTALLPVLPLFGQGTIAAKAGYTSVMVLLYGTFPGIYSIVAAAVADAFGPVHYKANFGLLFTQAVAYSGVISEKTPSYMGGLVSEQSSISFLVKKNK